MLLASVLVLSLPYQAAVPLNATRLSDLLAAAAVGDAPVTAPQGIVDTVMRYVPYAGLSYCPDARVRAMDCGHCQIDAAFDSFVTDSATTTHAVLLLDTANREIVVSVRGSEDFGKVLSLANFEKAAYPAFPGQVHATTLRYMQSIQKPLEGNLTKLTERHPKFRVVVVGHSLGGAIATLLAPILATKLKLGKSGLLMVSYGQPRVGDPAFVARFARLGFPFLRVVNEGDAIPHHPASALGYQHIPNEINFQNGVPLQCRNTQPEDPKCSPTLQMPVDLVDQHARVGSRLVGSKGC